MSRDPQFKIRIPPEIKAWLEQEAARSLRSVNAEIIFTVRERMEREAKNARDHQEATHAAA